MLARGVLASAVGVPFLVRKNLLLLASSKAEFEVDSPVNDNVVYG